MFNWTNPDGPDYIPGWILVAVVVVGGVYLLGVLIDVLSTM